MDLETIEKVLHAKLPQVRLKGKTTMTYNLYLGILEQLEKVHKYNDLQNIYDNMYKSNVEMAGQIKDLKEQLRKANELRSKTKIGLMEKQIKSALKYLKKATWMDTRERNELKEILGEKYGLN
jgi:DNA polymerase/3'-5' exonuclease PolX